MPGSGDYLLETWSSEFSIHDGKAYTPDWTLPGKVAPEAEPNSQ